MIKESRSYVLIRIHLRNAYSSAGERWSLQRWGRSLAGFKFIQKKISPVVLGKCRGFRFWFSDGGLQAPVCRYAEPAGESKVPTFNVTI